MGECCEAGRKVGVLHVYVLRYVQFYGGEVPYPSYACFDKHVGTDLSAAFGDGQHSKAYVHSLDKRGQLINIAHWNPMKLAADFCGV